MIDSWRRKLIDGPDLPSINAALGGSVPTFIAGIKKPGIITDVSLPTK